MSEPIVRQSTSRESSVRLRTEHLSVHFKDRAALLDVTLDFHARETTSLVGPNGAGKSTLLRVLAGILPPSHGTACLDGAEIGGPSPIVTYVPQRSGVDWTFPISVLDVVLMARRDRRSRLLPYGQEDRTLAREALRRVSMERFARVQIGALSGGQQQRVFLARALLSEGEIFLLDEPFAGVDIPTQDLVISTLDDLRDEGKTIVYATHDLQQAARSSDQMAMLNRRLIASGPPGVVMTGDNLRATFGGETIVSFATAAA